jgi:hypothetical protein
MAPISSRDGQHFRSFHDPYGSTEARLGNQVVVCDTPDVPMRNLYRSNTSKVYDDLNVCHLLIQVQTNYPTSVTRERN